MFSHPGSEIASRWANWTTDVAEAWRFVLRSPRFVATTALMCALGIGVNIAVFVVVDRLLFRPLPYAEPHRLVQVHHTIGSLPTDDISPAMLPSEVTTALKASVTGLEHLAWDMGWTETTVPSPGTNPLYLAPVTPNLLNVLGVHPAVDPIRWTV